MKKLILLFVAIILFAGVLMAQSNKTDMANEESEVLKTYYAIMNAMVEKDRATLEKYYAPEMTFRHMSGKVQTRKEFFDDIVNGKLNYYKVITDSVEAKVNGGEATISYSHILDALAYGARGAWSFKGTMNLKKQNGIWVVCPR